MQLMSEFSQEIEEIDRKARVAIQSAIGGETGFFLGLFAALLVSIIVGKVTKSWEAFYYSMFFFTFLFGLTGAVIEMRFMDGSEDTRRFYEDTKERAQKRLKFNLNTLQEKYLV